VNPTAKHEHQVSLDANTQAMHLDSLQSHKDDESMMEMSGRALAKLTGCYVNANGQESELELAKGLK
jgi:hypothetical protein